MNNNQVQGPLDLLISLFEELDREGVRYCHWKSTGSLTRALSGQTDLDLLVDRMHAVRFREILLRNDFKVFVSDARRQYPAVEDYLGFDRRAGALVHLHVHYRMILGEQFVKNYVLPLESAFLTNTRMLHGVKVPTPELEIIVLALRSLLKYRDRDVLHDVLGLRGRGGMPASVRKEVDDLLAETTLERIKLALERDFEFISPDLVLGFLGAIHRLPIDGAALYRLRGRVRKALAPFQRQSRWRAALQYYQANFVQGLPVKWLRQHFLTDRHKRPVAGGMQLAFIGADGAGKSTSVKHIAKWLSWRVNVHMYYMGTTHPSWTTRTLKSLSSRVHWVPRASRRLLGPNNRITSAAEAGEKLLSDLRFLAEGQDRYRRYLAGQREAAQGAVVIYDRYPFPDIPVNGHGMDGPRISVRKELPGASLSRRLARAEEQVYQRIRPPDRIVVMCVSPEVSQARKPEHRLELIQAKSRAIAQVSRDHLNVIEIDAEQPLEQVLLQIKTAIWSWL